MNTMEQRASTVAIAAPSSPQPRPRMSSGSSTADTAPAPSVTYIARRASPSERSSAARHMPRPSGTAEGSTQRVKRSASAAVSPVAPSRASRWASHG